MAKPVILAVDDDPQVLSAVGRDLQRQYARDFRVVSSDSGRSALEVLEELKVRGDEVALLLVDQRMPEMDGVTFVRRAAELYPRAKRALLTAYADTDAAIRAINEARLDYYITKPWDPPEDRLYPILEDLLDDWLAGYRPAFEGVRVIGERWSRRAHELREFLTRNQVPYRFLDVAENPEADELLRLGGLDGSPLPVVLLPDGDRLIQPSLADMASRVGLRTRAERPFYDLVIVGGGPGGLAAAVYGASEGLSTLLLEREAPGGQAGQSSRIENYLGFPSGLSGADLARRAVTQATRFGAEILVSQEAVSLSLDDPYRIVALADGSELSCQALVVATGVSYRLLDAEGAEALTGAGVYYGASHIEATSHTGQDVYVVGGGNSAGQAAMFLSRYAARVVVLVRGPSLVDTMSRYLIDQLDATANVEVQTNVEVTSVTGGTHLEGVTIAALADGAKETVEAGALFVFIGQTPRTEWLADVTMRDERGFILSGTDCGPQPRGWNLERSPLPLETNVPGLFVAGDVRHGSIKRVASATGEGAMAVSFVHEHLAGL